MDRTLRIGTRGSQLALTQTRMMAELLEAFWPGLRTELVTIRTTGDQVQDRPLHQIGVKGLFTRELDAALRENRVDLAVHSLKDIPVMPPDDILVAAIPEREDPRDAFFGKDGARLSETPLGRHIGTSSLRRRAQLMARRPDLIPVDLRGNIDTRLRKVRETEDLGGIILALAGVRRLGGGLVNAVTEIFEIAEWLPAPGQGALALTVRAEDPDTLTLVSRLDHAPTRYAVTAERALLAHLEGGCHVPIGAFAQVDGNRLVLDGVIADPSGKPLLRSRHTGTVDEAVSVGETLAQQLFEAGGGDILDALRGL